MRGYIDLLRPLNCCIAAVAIIVGAAVTVGFPGLGGSVLQLMAAVAAGMLFTGAGNTLNDYFDLEVDRTNHPLRPLPSGRVSAPRALRFAAGLFVASFALSLLAGWLATVIVLVNLGAMVSYEMRFKSEGWSGNLTISWLVASLFIFGGAATYGASIQNLTRVLWLGVLAFLATLGREIVKDIQDVAGDVGRKTLPMVLGVGKAGFVASATFMIGVALSPIPYTLGVLGGAYLGIVLVADGIFIYCSWLSTAEPTKASIAAKYGMVVALIAFLAGGAL